MYNSVSMDYDTIVSSILSGKKQAADIIVICGTMHITFLGGYN